MSESAYAAELPDAMSVLTTHDAIEFPRVREFADYWRSLASAGGIPAADRFKIYEIPKVAPYCVIYGVVDCGADFRIRLVGTKMVAFMGYDPTGKLMNELLRGEEFGRRTVAQSRAAVLRRAGILNQPGHSRRRGSEFYRVESLTVPLGAPDGSVVKLAHVHDYRLDDDPHAQDTGQGRPYPP